MKIAILGGLGFVGSKLSTHLSLEGHDVIAFVLDKPISQPSNFSCMTLSEIYRPKNPLAHTFDVVINLAAKRSTSSQSISEYDLRQYNFNIPRDFILQASRAGTSVLNASTYIQNFKGIEGNSVDPYAATKHELTEFLAGESEIRELRTIDLFLFTVYGPGDKNGRLVPTLISKMKDQESLSISDGYQLMNLMHVDDVVSNFTNAIQIENLPFYSKAFVWEEKYLTVRELVERIQVISGRTIKCDWGTRPYTGHEMFNIWPIPMPQLPNLFSSIDLNHGLGNLISS